MVTSSCGHKRKVNTNRLEATELLSIPCRVERMRRRSLAEQTRNTSQGTRTQAASKPHPGLCLGEWLECGPVACFSQAVQLLHGGLLVDRDYIIWASTAPSRSLMHCRCSMLICWLNERSRCVWGDAKQSFEGSMGCWGAGESVSGSPASHL